MEEAAAALGVPAYVAPSQLDDVDDTLRKQVDGIVAEIDEIDDELHTISEDIKDLKKEAKGEGFSVKTIEALVKYRANPDEWEENSLLFRKYKDAMESV